MNYSEMEALKEHFSVAGNPQLRAFSLYRSHTGQAGVKYINEKLKPNSVLDVGCGANLFKPHLEGVVGIDLLDYRKLGHKTGADVIDNIREWYFKMHPSFDLIYCIGPMNFGTVEDIYVNFDIFRKMSNRIFGHVRPGHLSDEDRGVKSGYPYYPWTTQEIQRWADEFGFDVVNMATEHTDLTLMSDEHIQLYKNAVKDASKFKGYGMIGMNTNDLADLKNIDTEGIGEDLKGKVMNEWNRRFDKVHYIDHIDVKVRPRLHYEFAK